MQLYVEPHFMPNAKKLIDSLTMENKHLHTTMNTPLCMEIRQGQFRLAFGIWKDNMCF